MAVVYPDTSRTPIWRVPPTRQEHPIVAWRCWGLDDRTYSGKWRAKDVYLCSVAKSMLWEGPVLRAHVKPFDAETWDRTMDPDVWHGGIYAVNSLDYVVETANVYSAPCIGEVDLWGRVVRFELGWRAEYCMIRKLYLDAELRRIKAQLERRYECDVVMVGGEFPYSMMNKGVT